VRASLRFLCERRKLRPVVPALLPLLLSSRRIIRRCSAGLARLDSRLRASTDRRATSCPCSAPESEARRSSLFSRPQRKHIKGTQRWQIRLRRSFRGFRFVSEKVQAREKSDCQKLLLDACRNGISERKTTRSPRQRQCATAQSRPAPREARKRVRRAKRGSCGIAGAR